MLLDIILRYSYSFDYIKMQEYFPNTSNSYTLPSIISVNARLFESNISYMWDKRDFVYLRTVMFFQNCSYSSIILVKVLKNAMVLIIKYSDKNIKEEL